MTEKDLGKPILVVAVIVALALSVTHVIIKPVVMGVEIRDKNFDSHADEWWEDNLYTTLSDDGRVLLCLRSNPYATKCFTTGTNYNPIYIPIRDSHEGGSINTRVVDVNEKCLCSEYNVGEYDEDIRCSNVAPSPLSDTRYSDKTYFCEDVKKVDEKVWGSLQENSLCILDMCGLKRPKPPPTTITIEEEEVVYHTIVYNKVTGEIGDSFYSNTRYIRHTYPEVSTLRYYSQKGVWGNDAARVVLEPHEYENITDEEIVGWLVDWAKNE